MVLYVMDASPGLFNGDRQEIECALEPGARLFLTNTASCRLHPSPLPEESRLVQRFTVTAGAVLEYFPEPTVPLTGARHRSETVVFLEAGGAALIGEMITPGRAGSGERFRYDRLVSRTSVYWDGEWTAWDTLRLEPRGAGEAPGFGEFTHAATLWVLAEGVGEPEASALRDLAALPENRVYAGVSRLERNGLVLRMLGRSAWDLQCALFRCWDAMRRRLLGRGAFRGRKNAGSWSFG